MDRLITGIISILIGILTVVAMNLSFGYFEEDGARRVAKALIDFGKVDNSNGKQIWEANWLAIQGPMWIMFFFGVGELIIRYRWASREANELKKRHLPEDSDSLLRPKDLTEPYKSAHRSDNRLFLPRLVKRVILQFRKSNSIEQTSTILNSSLELYLHELDLRYNIIRYVVWLIPTLGFTGTVIGIANALAFAGGSAVDPELLLGPTTSLLGVAFYSTLIALLMSAILVFLMHIAQGKEESALNSSGQYCLDNLVNRLIVPKS